MKGRLIAFRARVTPAVSALLPTRRLSLVSRIVLTAITTMVVGFFAILAFVQRIIRSTVYNEIDTRVSVAQKTLAHLVDLHGEPTLVNGRLLLDGAPVADNAIVDRAKAIAGADATIFAIVDGTPMRIATTIMKADGCERNVGTELVGPARAAFDDGRNFVGVSPVAGRDFINRYQTVRDTGERPIAILYSGFPLTTMYDAQAKIMRAIGASSLSALVICMFSLWLVTRPLRRVFENAVAVARGLARGDVLQETGEVSRDEVGDFYAAFREMIAYQQRMATVADAIAGGDLSVQIAPVASTDRLGIAFTRMLGNLRTLVEQLGSLALTDGLTQIGNLRAFQDAIRVEVSRAGRHQQNVSLVLVDVDQFKAINDQHGHQHGDTVLVRLAALLRKLRVEDCAYRIGGDEFAVILATTNSSEAKTAMERIRSEAPARLFGATLSIGLATSDGDVDAATLQRRADIALYAGKRSGRDSVVAFTDMHETAFDTLLGVKTDGTQP